MLHFEVKYVITSPLSLARILWWYGEDDLWPRALDLAPSEVADLARVFGTLLSTPEFVEAEWPDAPKTDAHLVLGTIEHLEGRSRPAVRRHRRSGPLPEVLDVSEADRWRDPAFIEVVRQLDLRSDVPPDPTAPWLRHRLHGRWASG